MGGGGGEVPYNLRSVNSYTNNAAYQYTIVSSATLISDWTKAFATY